MVGSIRPDHESQRIVDNLITGSEFGAQQDALKEQFVGSQGVLVVRTVVGVLVYEAEDVLSGDPAQVPPL